VQRCKAFRFRVYPTPAQEARLVAWESALRWLWNLALEQRKLGLARPRDARVFPTAVGQQREMTELRALAPWLADVPRHACAQLLIELDKAWQRCFRKIAGPPRWKRRGRDFLSVCENHSKVWRLDEAGLSFPKLGTLRTVQHRPLEGTPKRCTLRREGDQWFASLLCELDVPEPPRRTGPVVAIDRGITHLLADSDGRLVVNPRHLARSLARLARAQRALARRQKGSHRRTKAVRRVMRIHRKVRRQRDHRLHELSAAYAKSHGVVAIERLNVAGLVRSTLARQIADAGWSRFASMLRYKLEWSGGTLVEVPPAYSSQTCSACGHVDALSRAGVRFHCSGCGYSDHADLNAAKVLKSRANRSALPVEASALAGPRSGKGKVKLRTPRTPPTQSSGL
jgi:putative transposase